MSASAFSRSIPLPDTDMAELIKICELGEIAPGQMRPIDIEGLPPLAAFHVDGEIFVTSNLCTHNVAMLTDGYFSGDTVECPLHGGCFNVKSGEATQFPCEQPLQTYPVVLTDSAVFIRKPGGAA
jgi:nitrite reductase/ring-hydroxylating ferredoxin subunit